jgi:L-threonylcarbamoyladenylate synthase
MFSGKTVRLSAENGIPQAAAILRAGGTVAFPTETVYGLGANALDEAAVAKIFHAKERPGWDPVIVHVCDREMLHRVAVVEQGPAAKIETLKTEASKVEELMTAFWPGPLTLLLPRTAVVPDSVTAGRALVGVRMPGHPVALELIRAAGVPVAAPSANRFGRISPTTAAHVLEDLEGRIDAVLDGGATTVGVESTVLDVGRMLIYRPGAVTAEMISAVIGEVRVFAGEASGEAEGPLDEAGGAIGEPAPKSLPSPGLGLRHYAPRARLVLVESERELRETMAHLTGSGERVGIMLPDGWGFGMGLGMGLGLGLKTPKFRWGPWGNEEVLARRLFAGLRELDESGVGVIVCPVPEAGGLGDALRDRLQKAARRK